MRVLDWNGSGGLDARDLVTSVALDAVQDESARADAESPEDGPASGQGHGASQAGCATVIVSCFCAVVALITFM